MTHDELIAAGVWDGETLRIRKVMAEYLVDGGRFGAVDLATKSGSPNDVYVQKRISEIATAAMLLARLGYENVRLLSIDGDGKDLERPDLDCYLPSGEEVKIEVAEVVKSDAAKHDASRNLVNVVISDLIDKDATFAAAFGNFYFSLILNGIGPQSQMPIASKKEAMAMATEIEQFIRSEVHRHATESYFRSFPPSCPVLYARGSTFNASELDSGPYFSMSEGSGAIGRSHQLPEVMRVLNGHRTSAATYRPGVTWIVLLISDTFEFFNNTIAEVIKANPPISPFERAYFLDGGGRLEVLPSQ